MSHFFGYPQFLRRHIFKCSAHVQRATRTVRVQTDSTLSLVRFASQSNQSLSSPKGTSTKRSANRRRLGQNISKRELDASKKAALLLNRLSKASAKTTPTNADRTLQEGTESLPATVTEAHSNGNDEDAPKPIEIDRNEEQIQKRIVENRTKLLWPGIWTVFAVTGSYVAFAYLDARYSLDNPSSTAHLLERIELPQTWFLTPEVIKNGIKAGWNELDKLTIGVVVVSIGVHLMKKSPLPFWEKLIHITGEKKYTTFTYPFVHISWAHLSQNMFLLCWFMPSVVRYLDGDLFHVAALFATVPLLTSYLQHFAFRWGAVTGLPLEMGSSGAAAAMFGTFCMAYPHEKTWLPSFLIVRLDAMYWGVLFVVWQLGSMFKTPKSGNRPAYLVHVVSLGLGAAYVYLDGQNNIWKPLTTRFAKTREVVDESRQP